MEELLENMNTLMREILTPLRIAYKYTTRKKYREYIHMLKYGQAKRFTRTNINLRGIEFDVPDAPSFFSTYKELIYDEIYKFNCSNEKPVILDFGANIGLSVYFFEQNYPEAEIYAYEADPNIFEYLKANVSKFTNANIHLFNQAVCDKNTELMFYSEGVMADTWMTALMEAVILLLRL